MRERHTGRLASLGHGQQPCLQLGQTLLADRHQRHHRTAERLGQRLGIDPDAAFARDVHHVERDQDGHAHLQQLHGQIEMTLQVAGVEHVDDEIGLAPEQIVARDHLVERAGIERIDAGQVDHPHPASVEFQRAFLALDRHARPVARGLADAGQGVEEGRLAAVGIAGQGERQRRAQLDDPGGRVAIGSVHAASSPDRSCIASAA